MSQSTVIVDSETRISISTRYLNYEFFDFVGKYDIRRGFCIVNFFVCIIASYFTCVVEFFSKEKPMSLGYLNITPA